ncbi:MAG TPA: tetratricopeptide repeat protein [Pantanalinema sp.]
MALKIVKTGAIAPQRDDLIQMGAQAFDQGNYEAAATHFLAALEQDDQDATLFTQLGVALLQQDKYDKAVMALRQALTLDPYLVDAVNTLGVTMFKLEWYAASEVFFRRALDLNPSHPTARQSLVEAMRRVRETGDVVVDDLEYLTALTKPAEPTLSLCMIVKNEEKYLEGCLASVQGVADEIIVVDTGSTDGTLAIAERFGAKVIHFPWIGDFSAARNAGIEQATGDWILVLDADERLDEATKHHLKPLLREQNVIGYSLVIENYLGQDEVEGSQMALLFRVFQNRPDIRFEGIIHEQAGPSAGRTGLKSRNCEVKIVHYGYLRSCMDERDKNRRNYELLEKFREQDPENPYAYFQLGQTLKLMNRLEEAETNYARALELLEERKAPTDLPYYPNVYYNLGDLSRRRKEFDRALGYLEKGAKLFRDHVDTRFTIGLTYMDQERWEEAIPHFERCLELGNVIHAGGIDPTIALHKALNAIAVCHTKLGDNRKGLEYIERAIARHPNPDAEIHTNMGIMLYQEQDFARALDHFVAALERDPEDLRAWINMASICFRFGRYADCVEAWDKALALDPSLSDALIPKAEALLKLGHLSEAQAALEAAIDKQPESRPALLNLSLVHLLAGRIETARPIWARFAEDADSRALACLGEIVAGHALPENRPQDADLVRTWRAVLDLALRGEREEWIQQVLAQVERLGPSIGGLALGIGQTLGAHRRYEQALSLYLRAREGSPQDPAPYVALGDLCRVTGNVDDARVMFAKATELDPRDTYARRQLLTLGAGAPDEKR